MKSPASKVLAVFVALCAALTVALVAAPARPAPAYTTPAAFASKMAAPPPPRVLFIGDSYTEGTGAQSPLTGYAFTTARALGWDIHVDGQGGTGYVNPGPQQNGARQTITTRAGIVDTPPYDYIVVAAGINDTSYPLDAVRAAAAESYARIRQVAPKATLIVVGPWWPTGAPVPEVVALNAAIREEAKGADAIFVDPIRDRWITGSISTGRGNAPEYISKDGTHPSQAGHDYLGERLAKAIASTIG